MSNADVITTVDGTKADIKVSGRITVQTAVPIKEAVVGLSEDVKDIDIDVSEIKYLSSAGLRVFVMAAKLAAGRGGTMRLVHPTQDILDVLDMTGLINVLETAE